MGKLRPEVGRSAFLRRQRGSVPQWDLEPCRKGEVKPCGAEVAFGDCYHPITSTLPCSIQQLGLAACSPAGGGPPTLLEAITTPPPRLLIKAAR